MENAFELHGFEPWMGMPSSSPFVVKSMIHVALSGAKAKLVIPGNMMKAPKGKLPYLAFPDGSRLADSEFIYDYLQDNHGLDLEAHLTAEQRGTGYLLSRAFEEHFYFCILAHRWGLNENWKKVKGEYFQSLPAGVRIAMPEMVRNSLLKNLRGQGMGRFTMEQIYDFAGRSLEAIVPILGDKPFIFGDKVSYADTCIGPQVAGAYAGDMPSPLDPLLKTNPQLRDYGARVCALAGQAPG